MNSIYPLTKTTQFRFKLYPSDFYKVKKFYEIELGYPIIESWDVEDNKGVMFNTGAAIIELLSPKKADFKVKGSALSLQVSNVYSLWDKLKNHPNIVKPLDDKPSSWGDVGFQISDPEGLIITFFSSVGKNN